MYSVEFDNWTMLLVPDHCGLDHFFEDGFLPGGNKQASKFIEIQADFTDITGACEQVQWEEGHGGTKQICNKCVIFEA